MPDPTTPAWRRYARHLAPHSLLEGVVEMAVVALVVWEGTLNRYSAASHWSVGVVIGMVLVAAVLAGRGRQRKRNGQWARDAVRTVTGVLTGRDRRPASEVAATVVWVLLIAATIGWDMNSFFHQSHDLPTLSRLFGDVTNHVWGRILVFAGWLALGGYLAAGRRGPLRTVEPGTAGWRGRGRVESGGRNESGGQDR